ncbi:signal peptide peptidase SppA [Parabacteroides sp. 52]|uniref:signal peptide peptidase SppA n=1 Tax=unclassified Parabacteroides TaxID=2649774 RepID=UPI0013D5AC19|nr:MULTISPECIES: signal peptide peptidase SppA [unclassified Parabacteroides]MDH6534435.1 protease-4 [Parabacteroides sp. PM5-20]NDV55116.1 signal peptide peptidase SppA [Parabacteroides sp. 52]
MKSFFKMFFASTLGVLFSIFILSMISMVMFVGMLAAGGGESAYTVKENTVFKLTLNGVITDKDMSSPLDKLMGDFDSMTEADIVSSIRKAKENENIKGIYLKMELLSASFATLDPIRKALIDFKESGKFIVAYGEIYGAGSYMLASVADKVVMDPEGMFSFEGLQQITQFKKNQYDLMGIKYQVFKVGTFKSAVEPYMQEKMSEPNRLQVTSYLNSIWSHVLSNISESRNIPVDTLNAYADKALMFSDAKDILSYGLVDDLKFEVEMEDYIKDLVDVEKAKDVKYASLKHMKSVSDKKEKIQKDKIAILYAEGSIVNDFYPNSPLTDKNALITPKTYATQLKKLKEDENVKAVVFRVNSPGGSASASEQIWHAVKELQEVKPVVVSMGTYAASGGYYISCGASAIVAEPTTLTGSIGIFGLIPNGEELAKKMGLSFDEVGTNKFSTFGGRGFGIPFLVSAYSRGLTADESKLMQDYIEKGYDQFISRCAEGRNMTKEEIDAIGQGRVWTGSQALEIGLVDKLGGIKEAIALAAEKAEIEDYSIARYPEKKDFFATMMEEMAEGMEVKIAKMIFGPEIYNQKVFKNNVKTFEFRQALMPESVAY